MRSLDRLRQAVPSLVALAVGAGSWEILARIWSVSFLPPFTTVVARLIQMIDDGLIVGSLISSLTNLIIGFVISAIVGIAVGVLMGSYRRVEVALDVYVNALLTAPSLVFAPIFFAIFGLGRESIVSVIIVYSMFIIIVNTTSAVQSVSPGLIEMARLFGASDRQVFRRVVIPAASPMIMAGLRLGVGRAVKGMINGEMFIAAVGLGRVVMDAGRRFDSASVLAVLMVVIIVAFAAVKIVQIIDARVTWWLPSTARTGGGRKPPG